MEFFANSMELMTDQLAQRLAERHIELSVTGPAVEFIARAGFDPMFGARPLKRYIQHELESRLGRALVAGEIRDGARVTVGLEEDELTIRTENEGEAYAGYEDAEAA